MQQLSRFSENDVISEMAIVDTFTKLIFEDAGGFSARESLIIEAFREVDANVLRDSPEEMGDYLRNLGVREMIHLVSRLKEHMAEASFTPAPILSGGFSSQRAEH